jgi:hypothetical protein
MHQNGFAIRGAVFFADVLGTKGLAAQFGSAIHTRLAASLADRQRRQR